jgi:hypothetical protein
MSSDLADEPATVGAVDADRTVYKVAPCHNRATSQRRVHLDLECSYCPDDTSGTPAQTLDNSDVICQYCRGWTPSGSDNTLYNRLKNADSLAELERDSS